MKQSLKISLVVVGGLLTVAGFITAQGPFAPPSFPIPPDLCGYEGYNFGATGLSEKLRQSLTLIPGEPSATFHWGEKAVVSSPTLEWHESEVTESASFAITAVSTRSGGNIAYVAGITKQGADVIELWYYSVRAGGYGIRPTSGTPLPVGTAMPPYAAEQYLNGPNFIAPGAQHAPAKRIPLYAGTAMGHIREMAADPEGRMIMILSYPAGDLYRLDLVPASSTPTLVYSASTIPHLAVAKTIDVMHHVTEGRKYILTEKVGCVYPANHKRTVLADTNNDALFDSWATLTSSEWDATGYDSDSNWTDYQNLGVSFNW